MSTSDIFYIHERTRINLDKAVPLQDILVRDSILKNRINSIYGKNIKTESHLIQEDGEVYLIVGGS